MKKSLSWLGWTPFFWFQFFIVIPFCLVFVLSFLTRGVYGGIEWQWTIENYSRAFTPVYFEIFLKSLKLSILTATICLLLAYPMAWVLATTSEKKRNLLLALVAIPFLTNLIIRVYAIRLFVGADGPLQIVLGAIGLPVDSFLLTQNQVLVLYGLITTYLPFMIFPIYSSLEKFDFSLVEAAQDLGAHSFRILFSILIPNTKTGVVNGFCLVFIPCMGEFVIPDLLGGAKTMLVGNLITEQFLKARDWPFGAALSVLLILFLIGIPLLLKKIILKPRDI